SIFGAIYRRRAVVLLTMAGSIAVGLWQISVNPPDYVAVAEIMIPDSSLGISIDSEGENVPNRPILPAYQEDELVGIVSIMRSRAVVNRVVELIPGTDPLKMKNNIRGDITKDGLVEYTCYGRTAEEAVLIANTAVEAFAYVIEEIALNGMRQNLESFREKEIPALERVEQTSAAVSAYLASLGSADLDTEIQNWLGERTTIENQLFDLDVMEQRFLAQRPIIEAALDGRPEFVLTRQELQLPGGYTSALELVSGLSSDLAVARLTYRDMHPEIKRLETELDLAQQAAAEQAELILAGSTMSQDEQVSTLASQLVDMDIAQSGIDPQRQVYTARKNELDQLLAGVPGYRHELGALQADHAQAKAMAERISSRREEVEFHIKHGLDFAIIDPYALALLERTKKVPTALGVVMFTSFSGLLMGVFVALVAATIARMRETRPY
ncbi:MAG: GumC domain-containing protein, partial [Planctomycetota bacterium]